MPELPEVETIRRQLDPRLRGAVVVDGGSHPSSKFTPARDAIGAAIDGIDRRGKYLLINLDHEPDQLIVHLGMTGRLALTDDHTDFQPTHPHLRAWWELDGGRVLTFHDVRRFGRIQTASEGDYRHIPTLHRLGPEPWDPAFTGAALAAYVKDHRRHLKTLLLSQQAVAGVGNIYADEALWDAEINPATRRLSVGRATRLVAALQRALESGLAHGGTTLRDYVDSDGSAGNNQHELRCYGRAGLPCLRCGAVLRRRVLDARTTTFCPHCQAR